MKNKNSLLSRGWNALKSQFRRDSFSESEVGSGSEDMSDNDINKEDGVQGISSPTQPVDHQKRQDPSTIPTLDTPEGFMLPPAEHLKSKPESVPSPSNFKMPVKTKAVGKNKAESGDKTPFSPGVPDYHRQKDNAPENVKIPEEKLQKPPKSSKKATSDKKRKAPDTETHGYNLRPRKRQKIAESSSSPSIETKAQSATNVTGDEHQNTRD